MATLHGTLDQPLDDAMVLVRRVAGAQGYALAEGESHGQLLVFKKGVGAFSWGSQIRVDLDPASDAQTDLRVTTDEKFAVTDWGRGRRAAKRLLNGLGVEPLKD